MTVTEAARLLDLPPEATPAQLQTRYHLLRNRLQEKVDAATSSFLLEKHRASLAQLTAAYELLTLAAEVGGTAPRTHRPEEETVAPFATPSAKAPGPVTVVSLPSSAPAPVAPPVSTPAAAPAKPVPAKPVPVGAKLPSPGSWTGAPMPVGQEASPAPVQAGSKANLWIALIALLVVLGAGGWWFTQQRAASAEKARMSASLGADLADLSRRWDEVQAGVAAAEQSRAEIVAEQERTSVLATYVQAELRAREQAQAAYFAWASEALKEQTIPGLLSAFGSQLASNQFAEAAVTKNELNAQLDEVEQRFTKQREVLLTLGRPLEITSDPSGLTYVIIDAYGNRREGLSPASLEVPWGITRVTITPPGPDWAEFKRELLVGRELPAAATAVFAYAPARVTSSPEGLAFTLKGEGGFSASGVTPTDLAQVPTGPVVLTVARAGWPEVIQKGEITPGSSTILSAVFAPGTLVINSEPVGASVSVDGKTIGLTPLTVKDLPPGEYTYKLSLAGHAEGLVTGRVTTGSSTEVSVALDKAVALEKGQPYRIPGLGLTLMPIRAGIFIMGSSESEAGHDTDETRHQVRLTRDFWLGQYEVTQAEWREIMGTSPSYFTGDRLPVEQVSWTDAMEFCRRLTERERAAKRLPAGFVYTLPTEAQWEYACRAGTTTAFGGTGSLDEMGWHRDSSGSQTREVGLKTPNAWGLYDMHGNVWEWCLDWFSFYQLVGIVDPVGPPEGNGRVNRGGGWGSASTSCRSAFRFNSAPESRINNLGFRVALVEEPAAR